VFLASGVVILPIYRDLSDFFNSSVCNSYEEDFFFFFFFLGVETGELKKSLKSQ